MCLVIIFEMHWLCSSLIGGLGGGDGFVGLDVFEIIQMTLLGLESLVYLEW